LGQAIIKMLWQNGAIYTLNLPETETGTLNSGEPLGRGVGRGSRSGRGRDTNSTEHGVWAVLDL
jgi:hypothetical protein